MVDQEQRKKDLGFTERARRVLIFAIEEAARRNSKQVENWHLVASLSAEKEGDAHDVLKQLGINFGKLRQKTQEFSKLMENPKIRALPPESIVLSDSTRRIFDLAILEAEEVGAQRVGDGHLLLAVLIHPFTSTFFRNTRVTYERTRAKLQEISSPQLTSARHKNPEVQSRNTPEVY